MFKLCDFEYWFNFFLVKICLVMCVVILEVGILILFVFWWIILLKKYVELIGKVFGVLFFSCVKGLEDVNSILDVLDVIFVFSVVYVF